MSLRSKREERSIHLVIHFSSREKRSYIFISFLILFQLLCTNCGSIIFYTSVRGRICGKVAPGKISISCINYPAISTGQKVTLHYIDPECFWKKFEMSNLSLYKLSLTTTFWYHRHPISSPNLLWSILANYESITISQSILLCKAVVRIQCRSSTICSL